ncbi:glycosyltransferase [Cyclobacterium sp. 1_MG-2023]|uniref:glycosyltransferase n=1 Tax=Cyclobacterium sp. 1_MG-2023 TaxID=3062681 RepID=UPI0026E1C563|nr:glycosyltransferase [Cyclobacterium sp. 1_MG-2023]MDO6436059.1 glycosyltransferase [Cyclobacterium sp. 1_MG-2023]
MPQKPSIIIASVLKPVDDSRMLYKLGFSIRETNKYDLNIIGFSSKKTPKVENIRLVEIFSGPRTNLSRLLVPFKFLRQLIKIKPAVVIVTTYELLPMAWLAKRFLSFKLIYDVQENYVKNIAYNLTMPAYLQVLAKWLVGLSERLGRSAIDHHILAEKCYVTEMPNIKNYTVIENKAAISSPFKPTFRLSNPISPHFIISGTITPVYGVIPAVKWFLKLNEALPEAKLSIIGHCPLNSFYKQLTKEYGAAKGINLELSDQPLSVAHIKSKVMKADILMLPYQLLPSIKDKIPTKLYEGIALQKVILMSQNPLWKSIVDKYPAGMCIDFLATKEVNSVWKSLLKLDYYRLQPDEDIFWEAEKRKFQQLLLNITSHN